MVHIYIDSTCVLCSNLARFITKRDPQKKFSFGSLQDPHTKTLIHSTAPELSGIDSVIVAENGILLSKSKAALAIASHLNYPYKLLNVFSIFPTSMLDWIYDIIARNRYDWFGKVEQCDIKFEKDQSTLFNP